MVKTLKENMLMLEEGKIPEAYIDMEPDVYIRIPFDDRMEMFNLRDRYTHLYAFPLIANNWCRELVKVIGDSQCLEVCGGTGLLSFALNNLGANVRCTDDYSWEEDRMPSWIKHFTNVEKINALDAIDKYGLDVEYIILSWPPYADSLAYDILMKMRNINPNTKMIYIGEYFGGCTADDDFFNEIEVINVLPEVNQYYCRFYGIHDMIYLIK